MRYAWLMIYVLLPLLSCSGENDRAPSCSWELGAGVLSPDPADSLENVAVKDPSIVFHNGQYHLFYSARSVRQTGTGVEYNICCRYRTAPTLQGIGSAVPVTIDDMAGCSVIAPQIFYFEPDSLWYLVAHTPAFGDRLDRLTPIYMTNPDIADPFGWSAARELVTGGNGEGFRIDFWVICDERYAWLFYADQDGSVYRVRCELDAFPEGLAEGIPEEALYVNTMDEDGGWQFFEAVHIYYVQREQVYLAILEGARPHPRKQGEVDSRNRFVFGMVADSLGGTWRRIEPRDDIFLADAANLQTAGGGTPQLTQVSHPELIRTGYNQRLEIASFDLEMIFQSFDGSRIPDDYNYAALPWELYIMKNRGSEPNGGHAVPEYDHWTVSDPVLKAGPEGAFDELSVKDPAIVFYNGNYHLFYTGKATYETRDRLGYLSKNGSGLGYVKAPSLEELDNARRYDMGKITGEVIVAPQVFFFEPGQLWYIVAHTVVEGKPDLMPVYLTNPDIEDVEGWSAPRELKTRKSNNGFWIDFWVICDDAKAHLFYTDHAGSLFRFECPVETFPEGFAGAVEETVLTVRGENETGRWRMHEASHIYYVKQHDLYLNLMEAVYPHPTRKYYWDSRNRFMFGMVAEKLEGPWYRVEASENEFMGDPGNLWLKSGERAPYDQVSHFELIRPGFDQRMEINDYRLQLLFQAFDADTVGPDYDYNYLPWQLMVMQNY